MGRVRGALCLAGRVGTVGDGADGRAELLAELECQDPRRYWARRDALALVGDLPEAAPVLVAALGREPDHAEGASHFERGNATAFAELVAARCLRVPRPDLVPPLLEAARGPTPHRSALAVVLGRWRVVEAVPLLAEWVVGPDEVGALRSAEALSALARDRDLGAVVPEVVVPALLVALGKAAGPSASDRRHAVLNALRRTGDARGEAVALACLDDPAPEVRTAAAWLLAEVGGVESLPRLGELASGEHARAALTGLLRLADKGSAPALRRVLATGDRRSRLLALRALERCGEWRVPGDDRAETLLLGRIGDPETARERLVAALSHADPAVRAVAVASLRLRGRPELARPALDDPSPHVRTAARGVLDAPPPAAG